MTELIKELLTAYGMERYCDKADAFNVLLSDLFSVNESMNLTAITEPRYSMRAIWISIFP